MSVRGSRQTCTAAVVALFLLAGAASAADGQSPNQLPAVGSAMRPSSAASLRPDQIALLQQVLSEAGAQGLEPASFLPHGLESRLRSPDASTRWNAENELVAATLDYARAVHSGRLVPNDFLFEWTLRPAVYDPTAGFERAVAEDRLAAWLDSLPPPYAGYDALRKALATYRAIAAKGGWRAIAPGPELRVGAAGHRVGALRKRLAIEDATIAATGPALFDRPLAAAVVRAQQRFGLEPSGVLNKQTLDALNVPVERRVTQIELNMERWRWLPRDLPANRIELNIGPAIVTVFQKDSPVLSMRAIDGRPAAPTPIMRSQVNSMVLNPPWDVPDDIATKELWPKERAHPGFFARANFKVIPAADGQTHLQQTAGSSSAMGKLMFELTNPFGVYLHDTPSRALFDQPSRMVSHGCVRLEEPLKLADLVMAGDPRWTPEAIDKAIAAGETVRVPLRRPIAIFLLYWTADVGPDGQTHLRGDPYGWDKILTQRLDAADRIELTRASVAGGNASAVD